MLSPALCARRNTEWIEPAAPVPRALGSEADSKAICGRTSTCTRRRDPEDRNSTGPMRGPSAQPATSIPLRQGHLVDDAISAIPGKPRSRTQPITCALTAGAGLPAEHSTRGIWRLDRAAQLGQPETRSRSVFLVQNSAVAFAEQGRARSVACCPAPQLRGLRDARDGAALAS
jgi:hypothetical protein